MSTVTARQGTLSWFAGPGMLKTALHDSFRRLTPRYQWRNPVMFVVYIGSILTTVLWLQALGVFGGKGEAPAGFILAVTLWLWVTLLFANFSEAIAEGRSKAQAASLKSARKDTTAKKLAAADRATTHTAVPSSRLRKGDLVLVEQGEVQVADEHLVEHHADDEAPVQGPRRRIDRRVGDYWRERAGNSSRGQ